MAPDTDRLRPEFLREVRAEGLPLDRVLLGVTGSLMLEGFPADLEAWGLLDAGDSHRKSKLNSHRDVCE